VPGEDFEFVAVNGRPVFLKVTPGCYVRVRDITVVGTGVTAAADGSQAQPTTVVAVHMANGSYAAFEESATPEAAAERAEALVSAIAQAQFTGVAELLGKGL
jgi:hypothetical protein